MCMLTHALRHKKSAIRAARLQALRERLWRHTERGICGLCIVVVVGLVYHTGAFVARQPVAAEKAQMEHWVGQKMTELQLREKAIERKERRSI